MWKHMAIFRTWIEYWSKHTLKKKIEKTFFTINYTNSLYDKVLEGHEEFCITDNLNFW